MKYETAGHPINGLKWSRKTTDKIARELNVIGISVSSNTVCRLLKKMGYSLKVNHKKLESGIKTPPDPQQRDKQFRYIADQREQFARQNNPIISVDTKKKELIGNFKNNGTSWQQDPIAVNDHDFPSDAQGKAVPYGIYDTQRNTGTIFLGTSCDTPRFAVESIETWWKTEGQKQYPKSKKLLILADSGGSNSCRSRVWKYRIQKKLCDQFGMTVKVCHYPPGSSKWNPIEHRLFCEISKNWSGRPLDSYETVLKYIRTTKTASGLKVKACFVRRKYQTGEKVSNLQMNSLPIKKHEKLPKWSYSLMPSKM